MIPTRSTQQSSPASPCCCNSRPDGDNQFPEAQKTTRLPGRTSITNQESSKATSVPQQESTNPARPQVSPISAQTSPKTRGQRCRAQPGNPARWLQAGAKSLYKSAHWAAARFVGERIARPLGKPNERGSVPPESASRTHGE